MAPFRQRRWLRYAGLGLAMPLLVLSALLGYSYATFSRQIDERLLGDRVRALPRIYARAYELTRGQILSPAELIDRLNDLGYVARPRVERPGEFAPGRDDVVLSPRQGPLAGKVVRVVFRPARGVADATAVATTTGGRSDGPWVVSRLVVMDSGPVTSVVLEPPLLTALIKTAREKRRYVALSAIPRHMVQAVIAIEDRRFYSHPGVDPIGTLRAIVRNLLGTKKYREGGSTITQQLVRTFFLTPEQTVRRKLIEQFMALVLERRASKDEILELYLNEVYLGQRGSFAIHGVAEAARLFFGKDVANIGLAEAATIAGVIQTANHSPFNSLARARERRNVVLQAMAEVGFISRDAADRAAREPVVVVAKALDTEAPYFVDYLGQVLAEQYPAIVSSAQAVEIYTTLDLHLQRIAQEAVRDGLAEVDRLISRRRRRTAQAALIAMNPRTGDILAMVGGRAYSQSQYNRAIHARRQPGSVFKPFVYLAAFEEAARQGWTDLTPASIVVDEPTTFLYEDKEWNPANYENEYDGPITLRRALALSRNVVAAKVAERIGYDRVAAFWRTIGVGTPARPYPSIALGVFEASPLEIATAYTVFPNLGVLQPPRIVTHVASAGQEILRPSPPRRRSIARPETTYLVVDMMRSVMTEGTGAPARAAGLTVDVAGKSGTTNDYRDAWFVGFTPKLLAVVWVGLDDNTPLGLSGTRGALPIWTRFMTRALAGHDTSSFDVPPDISFVQIDRETGKVAAPGCPNVINEAFLSGTEPLEVCPVHR